MRQGELLYLAGFEACLVGGCVRDALLGRTPADWDICTAARPEETETVFAGERLIETGLRHGTVTVLLAGTPLEITTYRTDGEYTDGRHPDSVSFTPDLSQDLARRDFTVNARAWSPEAGLTDLFGGREDLAAGLIRCVGEPEARFREDALRILRALRFAGRYGFAVEPETDRALRALRARLGLVAPERIREELRGILLSPGAGELMRTYPEVFTAALPVLEGAADLSAAAALTEALPAVLPLRAAAALHTLPRSAAREALADLRTDNALRDRVLFLLERQNMPPADRYAARLSLAGSDRDATAQLLCFGRALARLRGEDAAPWDKAGALVAEAEAEAWPRSLR